MKKLLIKSILLGIIFLGLSSEKAQSQSLNIVNNTSCSIWLRAGQADCTVNDCVTGWVQVMAGTSVAIQPCSSDPWRAVEYNAGAGLSWIVNPAGSCGSSGGGVTQMCFGSPIVGTWIGNTVTFN